MFIEVLHDSEGNIKACYCADTLPVANGSPFTVYREMPAGCVQALINIDTLSAMEIEEGSGQKASLDPATGEPVLVKIERSEYIMKNFRIDTSSEFLPPSSVSIPAGMKVRGLLRNV